MDTARSRIQIQACSPELAALRRRSRKQRLRSAVALLMPDDEVPGSQGDGTLALRFLAVRLAHGELEATLRSAAILTSLDRACPADADHNCTGYSLRGPRRRLITRANRHVHLRVSSSPLLLSWGEFRVGLRAGDVGVEIANRGR